LLIVATTVIVVWGGYTLYKNSNSSSKQKEPEAATVVEPQNNNAQKTTAALPVSVNPNMQHPQSVNQATPPGMHRFIIEVAGRKRALQRYAQLKESSKVQMATADSNTYKLFFVLPATAADTARIRDSLNVWYPAINKRKGHVEW
jgi:hypothetical protein